MADYFEARYHKRMNRNEMLDLIKDDLYKLDDNQLESVANEVFSDAQVEYNHDEKVFVFSPHGEDRRSFKEIEIGNNVIVKGNTFTDFDRDLEATVVGFKVPKEGDTDREEKVVVVDSDGYAHDCSAAWLVLR